MPAGQSEALIEEILQRQRDLHRLTSCLQASPTLDLDITMAQLKALIAIASVVATGEVAGPLVSDLARLLGVTPATASTLIDRLVDRGLVDRREDPQDRRRHRCRLTEAGERHLGQLYASVQLQTRAVLSALPEEELREVLLGVEILLRAAERLSNPAVAPITD